MSFYEELLTLGQHLHERERLALYKFLIERKSDTFRSNAMKLINSKELKSAIANGEIIYSLKENVVSYSTRKSGTMAYQENVREVKLNTISKLRIRKLIKFFAQAEVEVIWNYPLEGRGSRFLGLINKLRIDDSDNG